MLVSENGFGKCTAPENYRLQSRGGKGLKTYKITEKTGEISGLSVVKDGEELIMVTSEGVVIRIKVSDISTVGRVAQGVKLVNLGEGVKVVSMDKINEENAGDDNNADENTDDSAENADDEQ